MPFKVLGQFLSGEKELQMRILRFDIFGENGPLNMKMKSVIHPQKNFSRRIEET